MRTLCHSGPGALLACPCAQVWHKGLGALQWAPRCLVHIAGHHCRRGRRPISARGCLSSSVLHLVSLLSPRSLWAERPVPSARRRSGTPRTQLWCRLVQEAPSRNSAHLSVCLCMRPSSSVQSPSLGILLMPLAAAYARRLERSYMRSATAAWCIDSAAILASPNSEPTRD